MIKLVNYRQEYKILTEIFNFRRSFQRIVDIAIASLVFVHVFACYFYLSARQFDFRSNTWVYNTGVADKHSFQKYCRSVYWAFQTLTTVGYGDFGVYNSYEIGFTCLWMFLGVAFYTFVVSSLTILISET